ncbi:MAG: type secretion protein [Pseudomonadota bacterium]
MIYAPKLLWGEGQFLRPQHFQRQDAYHEWRLAQMGRVLHPYAWGMLSLKIDEDALQTGVLRLLEVHALFPDGEMLQAPSDDMLPEPLSLEGLPDDTTEWVFHLAMAPLRQAGSNSAASARSADLAVRYFQSGEKAGDWYTEAAEAELTVLKKSVRLLASHENRAHLVSLPALRLKRTATGGFELDDRFVPPCVSIKASTSLHLHLRRLLDVLQAKCDALDSMHREPSKNVVEFRSGDVASFWLLHTANTAFAELSHLFRHPGLHPERLYQSLLSLAGGLLTFSKAYRLGDLPAYDHQAPGAAFARLDQIIRELLETVISVRHVTLPLKEVKPSFHSASLAGGQFDPASQLILGVTASLPQTELVNMVPLRFKLGAPDDVDKLVLSAMAGIKLVHQPQVPAAIPVRPGTCYFALEARGSLYERMLQAQALTLYAPGGWPDLHLDLMAINP